MLEPRTLLAATVVNPITNAVLQQDVPSSIDLSSTFSDATFTGTIAQIQTNVGSITLELFDNSAPQAVQRFLTYTNFGLYDGSIIDRAVNQSTFKIIQGGGFQPDGTPIFSLSPIPFEPGNSNVRGTIAMVTNGSDPNSATNQWFINDSDNRSLDGTNTVFGDVVAGMNVVDRIAHLNTVDGTSLNPAFDSELPVTSGTAPTSNNLVQVSTVTVLPAVTLKATADSSGLVAASLSGNTLTLTPTPGKSGIAFVTVTALDLSGTVAADTFRVEIKPAATRALDVSIGGGKPRTVSFREANGLSGSINLGGPGAATVHFSGDGLHLRNNGGSLHVAGKNVTMMGMDATGTTAASSLIVRGQLTRKGVTQFGDVTTDGAFSLIKFHRAQLLGDMSVPGGAARLLIDYAHGGTITVGALANGRLVILQNASWFDENFSSAAPIQRVRSFGWGNGDSVSESFQAPYVNLLVSRGSFTPGLQLTGTGAPQGRALRTFRVRGTIGGTWSAASTANLRSLSVGGIDSDFNATFPAPLRNISVRGNVGGSITAPSIQSFNVRGLMNGAKLVLQAPGQDLGSLSVQRGMVASLIDAAGNIGSISTRLLASTNIYAGIGALANGKTVPASVANLSASNFVTPASIGAISLHPIGRSIGFTASNVAASSVGNLNLVSTLTDNVGSPFGVAALSLARFSAFDKTSKKPLVFNQLTTAAQSASSGDLQINILS